MLALASATVNKIIRGRDMAQESTQSLINLLVVLHRGLSIQDQIQQEEDK